jgi:hypothetical protein
MEVALILAPRDANAEELFPPGVRVAALPTVFVVGSTLRKARVLRSKK